MPQPRQSSIDRRDVNQDVTHHLDGINERFIGSQKSYEEHYFRPWKQKSMTITKEVAQWPHRAYRADNSYGVHLQPLSKEFFEKMQKRANFTAFGTQNLHAITLKKLNIRAMPTDKPLFFDPKKAGEGFPFDYLQNATIAPNKPLFISHYSKDRAWAFVESSFTFGWVEADGIAIVDAATKQRYMRAKKLFVIKEPVALFAKNHTFLFYTQLGMMLPQQQLHHKKYVMVSVSKEFQTQKMIPLYIEQNKYRDALHEGVVRFSKKRVAAVIQQLMQTRYGWGGIYGERDCSSFVRDFFAPFGIWLPRNSLQQSKVGKVISLEGLTKSEKIATIKKYGVAFETLLYKRGHILLYVGIDKGDVIVLHNTWGIKTKDKGKEGRYIIAKPIFSTLHLGVGIKEFDPKSLLLEKITQMNIVTR